MRGTSHRGQAALESLGIGVVVAVLLVAVSAWLAREVRPRAEPPAVIAAVATPLERDPRPFEWTYPLPPRVFVPRGRADEPIGRALRVVGGRVREGVVLGGEMNDAFDRGFKARLRRRGLEAWDDIRRNPLDVLTTPPDLTLLTPGSATRQALRDAARLYDYAQELRSMPLREAALKASEDAGAAAADLAVDAGEAYVRRGVGRAARRAGDRIRRRPPGPGAPETPGDVSSDRPPRTP